MISFKSKFMPKSAGRSALSFIATFVGGSVLASCLVFGSASAGPAPDSFADLSERLLPAVVNIATTQTVKASDTMPEMPQFPQGSPFDEMFRDFFNRQGRNAQPRNTTALGSGFIIDSKGLVVTNAHVVADADEITVILHDEKALKATIVGRDAKLDIALLKLVDPPANLPFVAFGDSDKMRVGDWVIAIGNPFGLGGSVSAGIISARARDIQSGPYDDFFQTDAAINRGNSGGPLFNLNGDVIGINTAIYSPSGGSVGIGFSIPSNLVKSVVVDLEKYGKAHRGWLGVRIQTVTDEIAETLGLSKDQRGALVSGLAADGPAAKAGILAGDIIVKFDGKDVTEMRRLPRIVAETPINKEVEVVLWRDGKKIIKKAVVGPLPESEDDAAGTPDSAPSKGSVSGQVSIEGVGLTLAPLSDALREKFDIAPDISGVVVLDVDAKGNAAERGIRPGDVIIEISRESVNTPAQFADQIKKARTEKRKSVLLLVLSEGIQRWVPLRIDAADVKK